MTLQKSQLEASQNINQIVEGRVKEKNISIINVPTLFNQQGPREQYSTIHKNIQ
jgi:hypothetical protein